MSVSYITGGGHYQSTGSTTNTVAINFTGGGNAMLIAYYAIYAASDDSTSVKWNGTSLTKVGTAIQVPGDTLYVSMWYLPDPAVGNFNLVGTESGSNRSEIIGLFYSGVPSRNLDNSKKSSGTSNSVSVNTITITNNAWAVLGSLKEGDSSVSSSTNYTQRVSAGNGLCAGDSNAGLGTPGSKTQSITWGNSAVYAFQQATIGPIVKGDFFQLFSR